MFLRIVGIASVSEEEVEVPVVLMIKKMFIDLLKKVLLHSVFFYYFISSELILWLDLKMEIFDWSAGLLLDLSFNFAHKCYLYLTEYLLKYIFICLE